MMEQKWLGSGVGWISQISLSLSYVLLLVLPEVAVAFCSTGGSTRRSTPYGGILLQDLSIGEFLTRGFHAVVDIGYTFLSFLFK